MEQILSYELNNHQDYDEAYDFQAFADTYGKETDLRITIIDTEGTVLADSTANPLTMENHKNRTEFRSALRGMPDSSMRFSATVGQYYFYYAIPLMYDAFEGSFRVSIPVANIETLILELINSIIIGLAIGFVLSFGIAYLFTKRIMSPINELTRVSRMISAGDYDNKVYVDNHDQTGEMAEAFNTMTYNLRRTIFEVKSKNAEMEAIMKSMDTGLAAVDEEYRIVFCNEPFMKLMGLSGNIVGKIFYEVTRNPHVFDVIEKSVDEDEFISEETKVSHGERESIIKISATPIRNYSDLNASQGILLAVEDVTELRKLENIRRDFVSNVSHELKTPLTSIKGFVEALKQGAIEDKALSGKFLDIIDIEADRLTVLIEDILSLSEIESMKMDKNTGSYDVGAVVDEVTEMLNYKANKKGISIVTNIQDDLPPFICNRDRLKQLFINLIDNSIKYTVEGSVTVECKESRDKSHLEIKIIDTGIGIEEEHLERLFERFYRVDKGRSRKMGGTGLGLSIVKHIVELYNGTVQVSSTFGEGTTMKVRLPYR